MLVLSLLIMGIATFLIGFLPTYETIGVLAPILLVVLRFCQGIGVGGEWGGAVLMAVEHAPEGRRGFFGSWPQMGVPAGSAARQPGLLRLLNRTPRVVGLAGAVPAQHRARRRRPLYPAQDPGDPGFHAGQGESGTEASMPILDVLRTYPKNVLLAMGMRVAENGTFYVLTVFVLAYIEGELGLEQTYGPRRRPHRRRHRARSPSPFSGRSPTA